MSGESVLSSVLQAAAQKLSRWQVAVLKRALSSRHQFASPDDVPLQIPDGYELVLRPRARTQKDVEPKMLYDCKVAKADDTQHVVYSVVLDPYQVDAQNDVISPLEIEETAHRWMAQSRMLNLDHEGTLSDAQAVPVESWIVDYPSVDDHKAARAGQPHKAFKRAFGQDTVTSGSWVMGIKINDDKLWAAIEKGDIDAVSIEGDALRTPTTRHNPLPEVEFIEVLST